MKAKLRLLCAAAALLCAAPPEQPGGPCAAAAAIPAGEGDGYGVKLCGREFIRAVIFTCGGSRWKRLSLLAMEPAPEADSTTQTGSNKLLGDLKLQSILSPEVEQLQRSSPFHGWETFKDLYSLNDYNEYTPMANDVNEFVDQVEEAVQKDGGGEGIANPVGSNSYPWAGYPRIKRESLGLAGMCCKWGCTKAEISTICRV